MKKRIKILILAAVALIILVFFLAITLVGNNNQKPKETNLPIPTPQKFASGQLYITEILPKDTSKSYFPVQPVQVTFTLPVQPSGLKIETSPNTEVLIKKGQNPNSLTISPVTLWQNGLTRISILEGTSGQGGKALQNPQTYILNTAIPTIPPLQGAY